MNSNPENRKQTSGFFKLLASVKLTIVILTAILGMSIIGTLKPGVSFYYNPVYLTLLVMLGLNLLSCTLRRLVTVRWKLTGKRLGYLLTHIGMLVILIGASISLFSGVRQTVWMSVGQEVRSVPLADARELELGFTLQLVEFELNFHPGGMPQDYISTVKVTLGDQTENHKITVNKPLHLNGFNLYQSQFRISPDQSIELTVRNEEDDEYSIKTSTGETVILNEGQADETELRVLRYEPDFVMAGPGQIGSRSIFPDNPAILLMIHRKEREPETQWLFKRHKNVHTSGFENGPALTFDSVNHQFDTGLEIVKDPGTPWVAIGAFLLVFGLFFYLIPLKILEG